MVGKTGNMSEYLFHEGTNFFAYKFLGCHMSISGEGYRYTFRTWAPSAFSVSVVGDFCDWDNGMKMSMMSSAGIWELSFTDDKNFAWNKYKFKITGRNGTHYKGDPYAFYSVGGADGASFIVPDTQFVWNDAAWLSHRKDTVCLKNGKYLSAPLNIYEVHLASFLRHDDGSYLTYIELADKLAPYVKSMGYTHIELLPITEYPYDGSWGYQVCGYYAPTSRFGRPDDFRYFINKFHEMGIGVLLDWVPAHFPKDGWGLYEFDGSPLYEYQGIDRQESRSWGTRYFDVGREEVQCFLISSAMYWITEFHIDGLRVDAVSSMLYLDYDRKPGEWIPNIYGDNKNLEAISFLKKMNNALFAQHADILMIAEESTSFGGITHPTDKGGLGFNLKWNMGFANDFYDYLKTDSYFRQYHHSALNFPIMYAFNENYILPISHDEVVHGKKSFIDKMYGNYEDKFAEMRASMLLIMTYPGKKLLFMGTEFAQFREWDYKSSLEWFMLDYPNHYNMREFIASLNRFYLKSHELYEDDFTCDGFEWIYPDSADLNMVAYKRIATNGDFLTVVVSFNGSQIEKLRIPVVGRGVYNIVFDTLCDDDFPKKYKAKKDKNGYFIEVDLPKFCGIIIKKNKINK